MCAYDIEIRIKQKKGLAYIIGCVIVFVIVFAYILLFELFQVQYEIIIILNNF